MKLHLKLFLIFLSCTIIIVSFFQCTSIVYASGGVYEPGTSTLEKVLTEASGYLVYLATRVESIVNGDFGQ